MSVYAGSRYVPTKAYVCRNTVALKLRERQKFGAVDKFSYYTFIQGDTIDGIAYKYYGNAQYWWAIMDANPRYASEVDIKAGDILTIPSLEEIEGML